MSEQEKLSLVPLKIKGVFGAGLLVRPILEVCFETQPQPKWVLKIQDMSCRGGLNWVHLEFWESVFIPSMPAAAVSHKEPATPMHLMKGMYFIGWRRFIQGVLMLHKSVLYWFSQFFLFGPTGLCGLPETWLDLMGFDNFLFKAPKLSQTHSLFADS